MYALINTYIQRGAIWCFMVQGIAIGTMWSHVGTHEAAWGPYGAIWAIGVMSCHVGPCGAI